MAIWDKIVYIPCDFINLKQKITIKEDNGVVVRTKSWSHSTDLTVISFVPNREMVVPLSLILTTYFLHSSFSQPTLLYLPLNPPAVLIPKGKPITVEEREILKLGCWRDLRCFL